MPKWHHRSKICMKSNRLNESSASSIISVTKYLLSAWDAISQLCNRRFRIPIDVQPPPTHASALRRPQQNSRRTISSSLQPAIDEPDHLEAASQSSAALPGLINVHHQDQDQDYPALLHRPTPVRYQSVVKTAGLLGAKRGPLFRHTRGCYSSIRVLQLDEVDHSVRLSSSHSWHHLL